MSDEGAQKPPDTGKPFNWKACCLYPFLGVVALFGALLAWSYATHEEPEPDSAIASYHCQEMVKDQLRDPSSAEFSDETITGHDTFEIEGTVRATNAFGGMAVHTYECTAEWDSSDDSYYVTARIN